MEGQQKNKGCCEAFTLKVKGDLEKNMSFPKFEVALKKGEPQYLQDRSYFRISCLGFLPQDIEQVPRLGVKSTYKKYRKVFISSLLKIFRGGPTIRSDLTKNSKSEEKEILKEAKFISKAITRRPL